MLILLNCSIDYELILKYVDSLKWVAICLILFLYFRKALDKFFNRLLSETNEISTSFFTAKFTNQLSEAYNSTKDPEELKQKVDEIVKNNILEEIRFKSLNFMTKDIYTRERTANDIYFLAHQLKIDHILELAKSQIWGEHISALIAIKSQLESGDRNLIDNPTILAFIKQSLYSEKSRVSFRALQLIEVSEILTSKFRDDILALISTEENKVVKEMMHKIIRNN